MVLNSAEEQPDLSALFLAGKTTTTTIEGFREFYLQLLKAGGVSSQWFIIIASTKVVAWNASHPSSRIVISSKEGQPRYFSQKDFDFIAEGDAQFLGSIGGRYGFWAFIGEVLNIWTVFGILALSLAVALVSFLSPAIVKQKLADGLITSLSIFVTIYTVTTLALQPDREYRYLGDGLFHRLSQSDRFIGVSGALALAFAILSTCVVYASSATPFPWPFLKTAWPLIESAVFGLTVAAASLSLWFVFGYHFDRRQQLQENAMVKGLLDELEARVGGKREA